MIAAKELRLGNWINVKYNDGVKPCRISNSLLADLLINDKFEISRKDCSPIPLTDDILLNKCGGRFMEEHNCFVFTWGRNGAYFLKYREYYKGYGMEFGKGYEKIIFNLHHFQNLFYDHSEVELKIKL